MEIARPLIAPTAFVAPGAVIQGNVGIADRAIIMFGVVIRSELERITIGEMTNIQDNAVLHADHEIPSTIGNRVTVGHSAVIHGATVGDHCLVGIGAIVLNAAEIGEGAWIAAGSVLPEGRSIPPWTLAMGTPAKPIRELTEQEIERQKSGVRDYLEFADAYRAHFNL